MSATFGNCQNNQKYQNRFRFLEFVSYFIFAVGPLVGNAVLVQLGAISTDFLTDPTAVLIAIPAFMFPFAFFQLFSGAISDVYGRVPVILAGLGAFGFGLLLIIISDSIGIFTLANFVSGVGFGFINPVILALLSDCAIPKDIPKRMGIASALSSFSVGFGPFIAGQMVVFGWRLYYLVFLLLVIFGIFAFFIAKRPARKVHNNSGVRMLVENFSIELRKSVVVLMLITTLFAAFSHLGALVWTSRGLAGAFDETLIGLLLLGNGIAGGVSGSVLGLMVRRLGYKKTVWMGFVSLFAGLFVFVIVGDVTLVSSVPFVFLGLILVGWAAGFLFPTLITVSQVISPERRGVLAGIVTFAFFFGSALNPSLYEPLFIVGMKWLYLGIIGVSGILFLLFNFLLHKIS